MRFAQNHSQADPKLAMAHLLKRTLALAALWITTFYGAPAAAFDFADVASRAEVMRFLTRD